MKNIIFRFPNFPPNMNIIDWRKKIERSINHKIGFLACKWHNDSKEDGELITVFCTLEKEQELIDLMKSHSGEVTC